MRTCCAPALIIHNFPSAARATSASLRGFEIAGRRPSTAKCWRSMAFRISCPPRLKSSRSTANSLSTLPDQRQSALEPFARALHFKFHHLAKRWRVAFCPVFFAHSNIGANPPAANKSVPCRNPRLRPARSSPVAARCKCNRKAAGAPHRDSRTGRGQDGPRDSPNSGNRQAILEGFETRDGLVLTKCDQEIGEFVLRNVELLDGLRQRDKHWMPRTSRVTGVEFPLPVIQQQRAAATSPDFISKVIGNAAVGINFKKCGRSRFGRNHVATENSRHGCGQPAAVFLGFNESWGL